MNTKVLVVFSALVCVTLAGDINRQSIVFHEETPEVFYCPQVRINIKKIFRISLQLIYLYLGKAHFLGGHDCESQTPQ